MLEFTKSLIYILDKMIPPNLIIYLTFKVCSRENSHSYYIKGNCFLRTNTNAWQDLSCFTVMVLILWLFNATHCFYIRTPQWMEVVFTTNTTWDALVKKYLEPRFVIFQANTIEEKLPCFSFNRIAKIAKTVALTDIKWYLQNWSDLNTCEHFNTKALLKPKEIFCCALVLLFLYSYTKSAVQLWKKHPFSLSFCKASDYKRTLNS